VEWTVFLPWLGRHSTSKCSLFPVVPPPKLLEGVEVFTDEEISAIRNAPMCQTVTDRCGKELLVSEVSAKFLEQQGNAVAFIHDNVGAGAKNISVHPLFTPKSTQGGIHISFKNIFEIIGNVSIGTLIINAGLYFRLPILGLIKIADINGPLTEDKNKSVKFIIALTIANGNGVVWVAKGSTGRLDLFLDLQVKFKWLPNIAIDITDLELSLLPF